MLTADPTPQPREISPLADFAVAALPPGHRGAGWLSVDAALAAPPLLPALVAKGRQPGRTLFAVAGVHGDEYEGMEAIREVFAALDVDTMRGAFVGLPVANPFAYEARARCAPTHIDGLNLARVFPGDPNGSPSLILAHHLLRAVERNLGPDDLFLDFHSGSADVAFATMVGVREVANPGRFRAEEAARHFGLSRLWSIPDGAGPFNAETARRGIPTVGTETTGRAGCRRDDVASFSRGLHNLLAHLGIVPAAPPPRSEARFHRTTDVHAPAAGFFRAAFELDGRVEAGAPLGEIVGLFGEPVAAVAAPVAGAVWARRTMPAVRVGELLAMIAE